MLLVPLFVMVNAATSLRALLLFVTSKGTVAASTNGFCVSMRKCISRFGTGIVKLIASRAKNIFLSLRIFDTLIYRVRGVCMG